jgi:alpha-ketoglutarate-dependent taurine dioxygenase
MRKPAGWQPLSVRTFKPGRVDLTCSPIPIMVRISVLDPEKSLPALIVATPSNERGHAENSLARLYTENTELVEQAIHRHGAILFRGFDVDTPGDFARLCRAASQNRLMAYVDGNSPRTRLGSGIYTSTEYPPDFFISLHNELSYSHRWPSVLWFCCLTAAEAGGETPIADCRAILAALDKEIVEEFTRKQVKYIRRLHGGQGFGPSWQDTFETRQRAVAERFCAEGNICFEWSAEGDLCLTQVRPALATHPATGQTVWFNQADQFHPSSQPSDVYKSVIELYRDREDQLPQNVRYGDDTEIDAAVLEEIRKTALNNATLFPWRCGDVLMVDNMLVAHGRMPFRGARRVLVSMM